MPNEVTQSIMDAVTTPLREVPEFKDVLELLVKPGQSETLGMEPMEYLEKAADGYRAIIEKLSHLTEEELEVIKRAHCEYEQRNLAKNSAAHGGADHFLEVIGSDRQQLLPYYLQEAVALKSPHFQAALRVTVMRLMVGHYYYEDGIPLNDNTPEHVMWALHGHTKGLSLKATIHFGISHFIEQTMTDILLGSNDSKIVEMASHKDFFLNAMTDTMRLMQAEGSLNSEIFQIWSHSRNDGGLGWASSEKQQIFDEQYRLSMGV